MKPLFLILLMTACALTVVPQSGRKLAGPRSTPMAPIQPPANPLPEIGPKPVKVASGPLLFLPLGLRERPINALDSGSFRLDDFYGKVIVINVWASWCGPCRREVPEYESVRKAYADREVEFIGLTTENPRTDVVRVTKFVRDVGFGFRLGWADDETADILMNGRDAIPQTIVVDGGGRVVNHWTGFRRGGGDRLKQAIDIALQITH
jgi:thiol-disulfide isomerase/thioredoxin